MTRVSRRLGSCVAECDARPTRDSSIYHTYASLFSLQPFDYKWSATQATAGGPFVGRRAGQGRAPVLGHVRWSFVRDRFQISGFRFQISDFRFQIYRAPAAFKSANSLTTCSGAGGGVGRWSPVGWNPFSSATHVTVMTVPSGEVYE